MNFISTVEVAQKWGITANRISILAKQGRIPGAKQIGTRWWIPADAEKPKDNRTQNAKLVQPEAVFFRYPLFEHKDLSSFYPPLSDEELILKQVAEAFYACRFDEANEIMGNLPEKTNNKYIRISALYEGCMIDYLQCRPDRFLERYGRLQSELVGDFPYKTEMKEYIHEIDSMLGLNTYFAQEFRIIPGYPYHESFLPHLTNLCAVSLSFADKNLNLKSLELYEESCILLKNSRSYIDLQAVHIYLGCAYAFLKHEQETYYHFGEALKLAKQYELYFYPAVQYYYLPALFTPVLSCFDTAFQKKLKDLSDFIHTHYLDFSDKIKVNSIYKLLSNRDYLYLYYAVKGYKNHELAEFLHVSESTVSKHYSNIYASLGVRGKEEMISLYNSFFTQPRSDLPPSKYVQGDNHGE